MNRIIGLVFIFSFILLSCSNEYDKQANFLIPNTNNLELISTEETIMTTVKEYRFEKDVELDRIKNFPKSVIDGKEVQQWHKASLSEVDDLTIFFDEEPIPENTTKSILEGIGKSNVYVSYLYNYNKSAPPVQEGLANRNREPLPGEEGYNPANWIDIYYLDLNSKSIIHISYGKF